MDAFSSCSVCGWLKCSNWKQIQPQRDYHNWNAEFKLLEWQDIQLLRTARQPMKREWVDPWAENSSVKKTKNVGRKRTASQLTVRLEMALQTNDRSEFQRWEGAWNGLMLWPDRVCVTSWWPRTTSLQHSMIQSLGRNCGAWVSISVEQNCRCQRMIQIQR